MNGLAVLKVDAGGIPVRWIRIEDAAAVIVSGRMLWSTGQQILRLHGGINRRGEQSILDIPGIVAVHGHTHARHANFTPPLCNRLLFRRDRHMCLYCGEVFQCHDLTRDHILPSALGGRDRWSNVATACRRCNTRKGCRTPEGAHMQLLAVPYEPNLHEWMFLANHNILADQMEFLRPGFTHFES